MPPGIGSRELPSGNGKGGSMFGWAKDPSRKSDAMLWREYKAHERVIASCQPATVKWFDAVAAQKPVRAEIESRGYDVLKLSNEDGEAKILGRAMNFDKCRAGQGAKIVEEARQKFLAAYDEGATLARLDKKGGISEHEYGLVNVIVSHYRNTTGMPVSDQMVNMAQLEAMPFKEMRAEDGKRWTIEYCLWLEFPNDVSAWMIGETIRLQMKVIMDKSPQQREFITKWMGKGVGIGWMEFLKPSLR